MFGKEKKEQAREALHRGIKAILIGGFFHVEHTDEFGLNEEASARLYTEALAHQIYMLNIIFQNTLAKKYQWATVDFMSKAMSEAVVSDGITSIAFHRCSEIDSLTPEERTSRNQFLESAERVAEFDPAADTQAIAERLGQVAKEFFDAALPMFR